MTFPTTTPPASERVLRISLLSFLPGLALVSPASAQDAWVDLPSAPSGFSQASAIYGAPRPKREDGFTLNATFSSTYDSNATQGSDGANPRKSDFILSPGFSASYISKGTLWIAGASYGGSYDEYLDLSQFSGLNQSLNGFAGYRGGKLIATIKGGVTTARGVNRFYGDYVEQTLYSTDLIARYYLSPKTSLVGNIGYRAAIAEESRYNDTSSFDFGLAALWHYSALTDIGPGIRYTLRTGDNQEDRTTIGPTLNLNYQLSTKVSLRSRIGVDFVDFEDSGSSDPTFSSSIGLNYQASLLWALSLSFFRDTQADPNNAGSYNEVTNVRLGYVRKIRRGKLNLGVGYESRSSDETKAAVARSPDYDYFTLDTSFTYPIIGDSTDLTFSIRYRDLSAKTGGRSWDGVQTGIGLSHQF